MCSPGAAANFESMRILVVSNLYPPVVRGGYEVECSRVVDRLRERHEVTVLTSSLQRGGSPPEPHVRRTLTLVRGDERGSLRAPLAALGAVGVVRRVLGETQPDLVYVWNASQLPHAGLRVIADAGVPMAVRVCEQWFGRLFVGDQFMRELLPARRGPARAAWAAGCRALNLLPALRLRPTAPLRTAISWGSEAIRRMVQVPAFVEPVLERVGHPVPPHGELYAGVVRNPAPEPEIVFLGRVTPYKGVAVALEALALLRSEHGIPARLVVIGPEDSPHGADMRRLAKRLGIAGAVSWGGQATPEQAAGVLARAHVLIVPSVWQEPFGLVTIEGAFARVPLVAADVGGISEGMHDEEHVLLFPREDARAAAAALARTLHETEETAARVQRAHARAQEFRLGPYLDAQERFVLDAYAALTAAPPVRSAVCEQGTHDRNVDQV
jgi:glycosyltransferase involved in cell wall biosynthesis